MDCKGVDVFFTEEEILKASKAGICKILQVKRFSQKDNTDKENPIWKSTGTMMYTFEGTYMPKEIKIYDLPMRVQPYITHCFVCLRGTGQDYEPSIKMNSTAFQAFKQVATLVFPPQCFDTYFVDFDYLDVPCFKATLSKGLGLGIILGSVLVKVPQIAKILNNKSGAGINLASVTLDLTAITIYMAYNFVNGFPFSSWGDTMFLAVQTVLIGALVLWYGGKKPAGILYLAVYLGICYVLMGGITPLNILTTLTSINIPIIASGKVLQATTNYRNGHTGQLAAATLFMLLAGSLARIFTSIQETGDMLNIVTYCVSTAANALLVFQLLYYWNVKVPGAPAPSGAKKAKKAKKDN